MSKTYRNLVGAIAVLGVLSIYALFQAQHLGGFQWNDDEGLILMGSWLMRQGYPLYTQLWWEQPPLFFLEIIAAFQLFGVTVTAGRLVALTHATLCLAAVGGITHTLTGKWRGAVGSAILLAITPDFFWQSRAVVRTLPAVSLITAALAFIIFYYRHKRYLFLILSAICTALALLTKLNVVPTLLPIGLVIILTHRQKRGAVRTILRDGAVFTAIVAALSLIVFIPFDLLEFLRINFATYFGARASIPLDLTINFQVIRQHLMDNLHLTIPAALAVIIYAPIRRFADLFICVIIWGLGNAIFLLFHTPLWFPLIVALSPCLAVLAGCGIVFITDFSLPRQFADLSIYQFANLPICRFAYLLICTFTYLLMLIGGWRVLRHDAELLTAPSLPEHLAAVEWLRAHTAPADFVITDAPMLAFRARRRVSPETCNNSRKRIEAQILTDANMIDYTATYKPAAIIVWHHFRLRTMEEYLAWLSSCYYRSARRWELLEIFAPYEVPADLTAADIYLTAQTAPQFHLRGYDLSASSVAAGETLTVTLYWQAAAPITHDYTVFIHAVDAAGQRWGQHDGEPRYNECPTSHWAGDYVLIDEHPIAISPTAPSGTLSIRIGMYDRQTMRRLPMFDARQRRVPEDSAVLAEVTVKK